MSGGERQMLAVGRALMSDPKLLMLDEPSLGLAPAVVESMYETFGHLHREGLTILLAEQSIELALEVSDFATVLQVGKSVLSGTAAALARGPAGAEGLSRGGLTDLRLKQQQQATGEPRLHLLRRSDSGPGSLRIAFTSVPSTT